MLTINQAIQCIAILELPCGRKFLRVLIFAGFPAIPENKFPQIQITANIFPAKIYSRALKIL